MVKVLGVDFVIWGVPMERRLQTGAVLFFTGLFLAAPTMCSVICIALLLTPLWWAALGYLAWIVYDVWFQRVSSHGGRRWNWFRHAAIWRYFVNYFPISLVKTVDLDPNKNYLFGYHPHGILSCGAFGNFATEATGFSRTFPGIKPHMLTLKANFLWPILRGIIIWTGSCDVSKESINWILTQQGKGNAAIIVVGGAQEALEAHPGHYNLTIKRRKGFVKMAIRVGASLVPVFSFGENDLFNQADNPQGSALRSFQQFFKTIFGFSPPLFYGRGVFNYTFGLLPRRLPVHTVVGKPIDVPQRDEPDAALVDQLHQQYLLQLTQLFDEHKGNYGVSQERKLHFI